MKPQNRIAIIVETRVIPIIQAGFDTYPELNVSEILTLCQQALEDALREEFTASNPPMNLNGVLLGFAEQQQRLQKFLREQESSPDDSGKTSNQGNNHVESKREESADDQR